jgi:hypothetical protein
MSEASQLHASIVREASTTTNMNLAARAAVLQDARNAAHRARTPRADDAGSGGTTRRARTPSEDHEEGSALVLSRLTRAYDVALVMRTLSRSRLRRCSSSK